MKFNSKIFFLLAFLLIGSISFSQDKRRIDSVRALLKNPAITDKTKAWALAQLGWDVSYFDLEEGLKYAEEAIALSKKNNYMKELAHATNVAGTIYMDLGNYPLAMDYLLKATQYYSAMNDKKGEAIAYGNLGIIYTRRGEIRKALNSYFIDYHYFIEKGGKGLLSAFLNIGSTYHQMKMFDSSLYFLNLALIQKGIDSLQKSSVYNNLASAYSDMNDLKTAKLYIVKAITVVQDTTQKYYLAEHYMVLGNIEAKLKNFPAALTAANRALTLSKETGVKEFEKNALETLSHIYEMQGNTAKSLEYYKLFTSVKDSLINQENERSVKFMEAKFETEKKEKEIELLSKDKKLGEEKIARDKILINAFIFGGIVLFLALSFSIYAFVNKRKANKKLVVLNNEVHKQRNQLLEKNTAITDSIQYARRIQNALLTSEQYIKKFIPDFFIINQPKDIVSGDFYWAYYQNNKMYFMCADCTGHGVPGAFMSLLGINFLNEIVIEKKIISPDLVLNELRKEIILSLNQQGNTETQDGMDCSFCSIDTAATSIELAAANNPVWIIRPPEGGLKQDEKGNFKMAPGFKLTELKPDKMPVGKSPKDNTPFTLKTYQLKKGDCVYMFSDGFADQFGGPKGKKMKYKVLKETILKNCHLPMTEQKIQLQNCFAEWKANFEQVDDVLVMGIKI
ncbi:MAG TPA: SpoIIE family protein phosphatase [Bacteroidia bacterium]|nr:SpoIIE family protein phosphatase [Bacteroidia bacterium]